MPVNSVSTRPSDLMNITHPSYTQINSSAMVTKWYGDIAHKTNSWIVLYFHYFLVILPFVHVWLLPECINMPVISLLVYGCRWIVISVINTLGSVSSLIHCWNQYFLAEQAAITDIFCCLEQQFSSVWKGYSFLNNYCILRSWFCMNNLQWLLVVQSMLSVLSVHLHDFYGISCNHVAIVFHASLIWLKMINNS